MLSFKSENLLDSDGYMVDGVHCVLKTSIASNMPCSEEDKS